MKHEIEIDGKVYWSRIKLRELYGMSDSTLVAWAKKDMLPPCLQLGKKKFYPKDEVLALFGNGKAAA